MKTFIDISWPMQEGMTEYKNRASVAIRQTATFEVNSMRQSRISYDMHTGTHIDAPSHFLEHGATVDAIPFSKLMGSCWVVDMTHCVERITAADLQHTIPDGCQRILFKTRNSQRANNAPFDPYFVYVSSCAAQLLKERNILLVGIDYLGIERNQPDHETHTSLLQANIVILEGLRLAHVSAGNYELICLPLAMVGLEAAPVRAVLAAESIN